MYAFDKPLTGAVLALGVLLSTEVGAQTINDRTLTTLRQLVVSAFPDLAAPLHRVALRTEGQVADAWDTFSIGSLSVYRQDPSNLNRVVRILEGSFHVAGTNILEVSFEGEFVNSQKAKTTAATVRRSSDWTADQMIAAFSREGARFVGQTPEEFLRAANLERFVPLLGQPVAVRAKLIADLPDLTGAETVELVPFWLIRFEVKTGSSARSCYDLNFEPFDARLIEITWRPCD